MTYSTWCSVTPSIASDVLMLAPSEIIHLLGVIGYHPKSSNVQMVADAEPLDSCHRDFDMANLRQSLCHNFRSLDLAVGLLRPQNPIHELT